MIVSSPGNLDPFLIVAGTTRSAAPDTTGRNAIHAVTEYVRPKTVHPVRTDRTHRLTQDGSRRRTGTILRVDPEWFPASYHRTGSRFRDNTTPPVTPKSAPRACLMDLQSSSASTNIHQTRPSARTRTTNLNFATHRKRAATTGDHRGRHAGMGENPCRPDPPRPRPPRRRVPYCRAL